MEITKACVYLAWDGRGFKIGITSNISGRLATLRIANPYIQIVARSPKMPLEEARNMEAYLHRRYQKTRIRGEWFELNPAEVKYIRSLFRGDEGIIAPLMLDLSSTKRFIISFFVLSSIFCPLCVALYLTFQ